MKIETLRQKEISQAYSKGYKDGRRELEAENQRLVEVLGAINDILKKKFVLEKLGEVKHD